MFICNANKLAFAYMQFITNLIIPLSVSVVVCNLILKSRHTSQAMFCLYYCMKICVCSFDNNCLLDKNEASISGSCYCICTSVSDICLVRRYGLTYYGFRKNIWILKDYAIIRHVSMYKSLVNNKKCMILCHYNSRFFYY